MGENSVLAGGYFILGEVEDLTGRLDEAKQKVNRAFNISRTAGDLVYQSLSLGLLGHFKNWQGEYTEAIGLLSKGYQITKENQLLAPLFDNLFMYGIAQVISNPTQSWKTRFSMGRFYNTSGKPEQAQVSYRAARDVIDQIKSGLRNPDLRSGFERSSLISAAYDL